MKNLKSISASIFTFLMMVGYTGMAQTTAQKIGTNPTLKDVSALLELEATNKGLLMPRVELTSTTVAAPVTTPIADALIVYNKKTTGDVAQGFYYWDLANLKWVKLTTFADEPWYNQATNSGANANTQNIYQMANVGIGTIAPNSTLQVAGSLTLPIKSLTATDAGYTLTDKDYKLLIKTTGATASLALKLPDPTTCMGRIYVIQSFNNTAANITVTGTGVKFDYPIYVGRNAYVKAGVPLLENYTTIAAYSTPAAPTGYSRYSYFAGATVILESDGEKWTGIQQ